MSVCLSLRNSSFSCLLWYACFVDLIFSPFLLKREGKEATLYLNPKSQYYFHSHEVLSCTPAVLGVTLNYDCLRGKGLGSGSKTMGC